MNDLIPYPFSLKDQFICGWYIDRDICKELIKLFQDNPEFHKPGQLFSPDGRTERKGLKLSTESVVSYPNPHPLINQYISQLSKCLLLYKKEYPVLDTHLSSWTLHSNFNIQWYKPGEGFLSEHCERAGNPDTMKRMLVFMTYLNTVTDGGYTEFLHQRFRVQPEEGLTLIWPSDFTHVHRGITSETQEKFITTGWFVFQDTK